MICALQGDFGCGKTTMAVKTAPKQPVHVIDIDRKIQHQFPEEVKAGTLTYWELTDTTHEGRLAGRLATMLAEKGSQKVAVPPKGWINFCNYGDSIESREEFKKAGTILIDSYTLLSIHLKAHMQFLAGKTKLDWDMWAAWQDMWKETTNVWIDTVNAHDKDLIITIHERVSEKPGEKTKQVILKRDEKGSLQRDYVGQLDVQIAGSVQGQFGIEFGAMFTDVYGLRVEVDDKGQPKWVCRTYPDGRRKLRSSAPPQYTSDKKLVTEFEPNFHKIWRR